MTEIERLKAAWDAAEAAWIAARDTAYAAYGDAYDARDAYEAALAAQTKVPTDD